MIDDGHRHRWRWHIAALGINHGDYIVSGKNLKSGLLGRSAQRVGIFTHVDWPVNILSATVFHDGLGYGGNVILVERAVQTGATVTRCSKSHLLFRGRDIGVDFKIGRKQLLNVD